MLGGKSRQRLETGRNKTELDNITSKSRERVSIDIPAAWLTSSVLYNSGFKLRE